MWSVCNGLSLLLLHPPSLYLLQHGGPPPEDAILPKLTLQGLPTDSSSLGIAPAIVPRQLELLLHTWSTFCPSWTEGDTYCPPPTDLSVSGLFLSHFLTSLFQLVLCNSFSISSLYFPRCTTSIVHGSALASGGSL